jgi:Capsular polysaccharide synthesis protein
MRSGLERWMFRWFVRGRKMRLKLSRYLDRDPRKLLRNSHRPKQVPRILWSYWKQGESAAPDLVKSCIASWRDLNPGWDVRVLDDGSVSRFTAMTGVPESISVQGYSDVLRVRLLDEHGGVWVDATTLCATPLDHWLPPLMQSGFFAFSRPGQDRVVASWFIASERGGTLIRAWRRSTDAYWSNVRRPYHYYWLHYLLEWVALTNHAAGARWAGTPHVSADGPHLIQRSLRHGDGAPPDATPLDAIPIHKLTWKRGISIRDVQRILRRRLSPAPGR